MLEFFEALLIFTGGALCVAFWLVLFIGAGIEIYDFFTKKTEIELNEDDL